MADKIESCIGIDENNNAVCVVCGGKIGFRIGELCDKENPYTCVDIFELNELLNVGAKGEESDKKCDTPIVRIIVYDPQSYTSIMKALVQAQQRLMNIKKELEQ